MAGFLRRYTSTLSLIDMLTKRCITLLPTTAWVDRNDRRAIEIYKQHAGYANVVGLCLTEAGETFHHWQVFAPGDNGVCIEFDKEKFVAVFADEAKFRQGPVTYVKLPAFRRKTTIALDEIPFTKRYGFEAEKEYRVIGATRSETADWRVPIDLSIIRSVTFSPFVNDTLAASVRGLLSRDDRCEALRWKHSRLIDSQSWLTTLERLAATAT